MSPRPSPHPATAHEPRGRWGGSRAVRRLRGLGSPLIQGVGPTGALRAGFIASCIGLIASWGVGFMPQVQGSMFATMALLRPLRVDTFGLIACSVVLVATAVVLFWAWTQLGRHIKGPAGLRWGIKAVIVWSAPWMLAFPVMSRDVFSYAAQGKLLLLGFDPYRDWVGLMPGWLAQGADGLWAQSSSPYGPLFLMAAEGIMALAGNRPEIYLIAFRLMSVIGVALCLLCAPRLARAHGVDPGWTVWIVFANPLFIYSMISSAHNDSLMIGLMLAGFTVALKGRRMTALLLVAAAIAIKPIVIIALPAVGLVLAGKKARWRARWGSWVLTGLVVGVVLLGLGAASGLWFGWIGAMLDQGGAAFPFAPFGLIGLALGWLVSLVGGQGAGALTQSLFYGLGKLAAVLAAFWLALRRPTMEPIVQITIVLSMAVLLNPVIQPWYLFWILPFFASAVAFHGAWEQACIVVCGLMTVGCLADQLDLPEWVAATAIKYAVLAFGFALFVFVVVLAPSQRAMFSGFRLGGLLPSGRSGASVIARPLATGSSRARTRRAR